MLSQRVKRVRERRLSDFSIEMFQHREQVFTETYKEYDHSPVVMKKARSLARFLREKEIFLYKDDLIAGYAQNYNYCEYHTIDDYQHNHWWKCYYPVCQDYLNLNPYWEKHAEKIHQIDDARFLEFLEAKSLLLYHGALGHGHVIPKYEMVLHKGLGKLRERAVRKSEKLKTPFSQSAVLVLQAFRDYIMRYSQSALELSMNSENIQYSEELKRIAESCIWISQYPSRNFFDALQLFWFMHEVLTMEQPSGSLSIGRFDQFMYPYYKNDLERGYINEEEAQELIDILWIKFNVPQEHWRTLFFQNIAIGGQTSEGKDATNELSYLCLIATDRLKLPQPSLTVRIHRKTPDLFFNAACSVIAGGGGMPAFFNDDAVLEAKTGVGVSMGDAINYGIVGCVEPAVPGREYGWTEGIRINWAKILELTLTRGKCLICGKTIKMPAKTLEKIDTFEDFYSVYTENLIYFTRLAADAMNLYDKIFSDVYPVPFISTLMEGCVEQGRDLTEGPVKYNLTSINGCGMANVADSLTIIKNVVFEQRLMPLKDLISLLEKNYEDEEPTRLRFINKARKFGNDEDEVDIIMKDLCESFCSEILRHENPRGGRFQCGLYSVGFHVPMGEMTGP